MVRLRRGRASFYKGVFEFAQGILTTGCATARGKVGRRDWTRTNDPHHVKVVL